MSVRGTDAPTILYSVAGYRADGVERELLLVDLPQLGRTLLDVRAGRCDDQHIVADGLLNCAEAGEAADAHVAASIAAGRPAVPTAEPPTPEQLRVLETQSDLLGQPFEPPRNRGRGREAHPPRTRPRHVRPAPHHAGALGSGERRPLRRRPRGGGMTARRTSALPPLLRRDPTREEELRQLWSMTAAQRITAMRAGRLTHRQLSAWASRAPREVPRLNGEFEFIAINTPEVAEARR